MTADKLKTRPTKRGRYIYEPAVRCREYPDCRREATLTCEECKQRACKLHATGHWHIVDED